MRSYAMWAAIYYPQATSVDVAHYYVETKRHVKKLPDGTLTVFDPGYEPATDRLLVNFPIDETKTFWSNAVSPIVERMKGVAAVPVGQQHTIEHPRDMASRDSPCQMFGGCGRKYACPHSPMNQMRARLGAAKQEQPAMSLASLLAQHSASAAETPKPAVPPSDGIVTADAGSRINPPAPVRLNEPPKPPPTEQLEAQAHLAEVAASHVDARDPADKALDEKANAEKHEHKYDTTIDGKAACACGRKKPGRTASAPKPEQPQPAVDQGEKAVANAEYFEKGVANLEQPQPAADETSAKQSDRPILLVNCHTPAAVDLTKYAAEMAEQVAKAVGAADPRFVDKSSPLAYGAWKGALTEHVRNNLPVGRRLMIWTRGDEVAEVVAAALAGVPDIEVVRS